MGELEDLTKVEQSEVNDAPKCWPMIRLPKEFVELGKFLQIDTEKEHQLGAENRPEEYQNMAPANYWEHRSKK